MKGEHGYLLESPDTCQPGKCTTCLIPMQDTKISHANWKFCKA